MSREVTVVPSLISNVIWQVRAYYVAFLLIEFQGLKCFLKSNIQVMDSNGHPHQKNSFLSFSL